MSPPECRLAACETGRFHPVASVHGAVSPELSGNKSTLNRHHVETTTTRQTVGLSFARRRLKRWMMLTTGKNSSFCSCFQQNGQLYEFTVATKGRSVQVFDQNAELYSCVQQVWALLTTQKLRNRSQRCITCCLEHHGYNTLVALNF